MNHFSYMDLVPKQQDPKGKYRINNNDGTDKHNIISAKIPHSKRSGTDISFTATGGIQDNCHQHFIERFGSEGPITVTGTTNNNKTTVKTVIRKRTDS